MAELFQLKFLCENLVRIGWAFQELSCKQTKKKKKKNHRCDWKQYLRKDYFSGGNNSNNNGNNSNNNNHNDHNDNNNNNNNNNCHLTIAW